jgi:peptidoglycan/LPS O-acetylase OafA/YrhL
VRVNELDSIRGIAAFVVVLHHLWETILPDQNTYPFLGDPIAGTGWLADVALWISLSPLRLLFSGHAAVGVFFVLSGFALTKSLENPRNADFVRFMIRRFFRIYPPFALIIVAAAVLCLVLQPQPIPGREWINLSWNEPLTAQLVLGHLAMISTAGEYTSLNSPMWTLVHELRISLVFIFLAPLVIAYPRSSFVAAIGVFALLSIRRFTTLMGDFIPEGLSRDVFQSFVQTARYILFFVFGILIASKFQQFQAVLERRKGLVMVLWPVAFILLAVPYTKGYLEICYAVGALLLIVLCMHSVGARRFLNRPVFLWLGKVSYSLYLSHQIVLIALVHVLHDKLPIGVIILLVLLISLPLAELLNRTVELPSSEIGKRLSKIGLPAR